MKKLYSLELKDSIKDGEKPWTTVGYIEQKCDVIKEDNFDGNLEGFPVGTFDDATFGLSDSTMLGVADSFKVV